MLRATFLEVRKGKLKFELVQFLRELVTLKIRGDAGERTFASTFGFRDLEVDFLPSVFNLVASLLVHYSTPSRRKSCKGAIKL